MEDDIKEYINAEFGLSVIKKKGRKNTIQMYKFNQKFEVLVCIASMTTQLIENGIAAEEDIKYAVEMGASKTNGK